MEYLKGAKKRVNTIGKWREQDGSWHYQVFGKNGDPIAELSFVTGKAFDQRLTNNDLLEIVADRLKALNESTSASFRSAACLQHVLEALFWADAPAHVGKMKSNNTADSEPEPDEPNKGE